MMIDDHDVLRAANLLIKHHGEEAALIAIQRANDLLANARARTLSSMRLSVRYGLPICS